MFMKQGKLIILGIIILAFTQVANGQVTSILKKKVKKTTTSTINEEEEKAIGKGVLNLRNKIVNSIKGADEDTTAVAGVSTDENAGEVSTGESRGETNENESMGFGSIDLSALGLGAGAVTIQHKDNYDFTGMIRMETESFTEESPGRYDYIMYFADNQPNTAIRIKALDPEPGQEGSALFVFDIENNCFMMLADGSEQKAGMISPLDGMADDETATGDETGSSDEEFTDENLNKTGRTKVIAGYKCDEYEYNNQDSKVIMWYSKDIDLKINRKAWQKAGMSPYFGLTEFQGGLLMAMETWENGKLTSRTETKEVNNNIKNQISLQGYQLIQVNADMPADQY